MEDNVTSSSSSDAILGIDEVAIQKQKVICEEIHLSTPSWDSSLGLYCPRVFDGWSCWNDTKAGTVATVKCPDFVHGFDPEREAYKICNEDGTWFAHPLTNLTWSNYTTCVDIGDLEMYRTVNLVYAGGYSVSLVALTVSLFIFFCLPSLKCTRITIHKNLFVSFVVNNAMYLIWHQTIVEDVDILQENKGGCISLHIFLHYFLMCNYFWMFCEGLYLHTLLVVAFVAEGKIMKWFVVLGWVAPLIFTLIYVICRMMDEKFNILCWIEDSPYNYILSVPVVLSLLVNLVFLVNIVRVLVTKLRAVNTAPDTHSTRKAVRATLILIPLLGLHYILLPFRPNPRAPGHDVYLIISAVATSFQVALEVDHQHLVVESQGQMFSWSKKLPNRASSSFLGLAVSILFCFFNGEVLAILKKKWNQRKMMKSPNSYAATTVSYVKSSGAGCSLVTHNETHSEVDDV